MLRARISEFPCDRILIQTDADRWSAGRLVTEAARLAGSVTGRSVALCLADAGEAVQALCALDGAAARLLLVAPSVPNEVAQSLVDRAGCDTVITDRPDAFSGRSDVKLLLSVAEVASLAPTGPAPEETEWVLATSGTTAEPKLVAHTLVSLSRTTRVSASAQGDVPHWGLLYEYARFAGLQVVLQALLSGGSLVAPDMTQPLERQLEQLADANVTHLSATPTMWRKIVMLPQSDRLSLKQISLGGEIADDRILKVLATRYPLARVTHIYASTEAGVGFSVKDGHAGFPASFLDRPPAGVELRVVDGRLYVKSRKASAAYLGSQSAFSDSEGWVDTGDNVRVDGDRVTFLGRDSGVINVGGNKVHPEEVERTLLMHPAVRFARVFSKKSPITGALVVAEIILGEQASDEAALRGEIRSFAADHLDAYKVPAMIKVVADVEISAAGKLFRGKA
jgi:acyl-CoA synthetase (AMP-forming)/AMP-acid ligase II